MLVPLTYQLPSQIYSAGPHVLGFADLLSYSFSSVGFSLSRDSWPEGASVRVIIEKTLDGINYEPFGSASFVGGPQAGGATFSSFQTNGEPEIQHGTLRLTLISDATINTSISLFVTADASTVSGTDTLALIAHLDALKGTLSYLPQLVSQLNDDVGFGNEADAQGPHSLAQPFSEAPSVPLPGGEIKQHVFDLF